MDLKVASEQEIQDELARRDMIRKNEKIKDSFNAITIAYNSGKIASIERDEQNRGTSVSSIRYIVHMK